MAALPGIEVVEEEEKKKPHWRKSLSATAATAGTTTAAAATATGGGGKRKISGVGNSHSTAPTLTTATAADGHHDARIGKMFDSHHGCSRYLAGEGVIHTRQIDFSCPLFFKEAKTPLVRKDILKKELLMVCMHLYMLI